MQGTIKFLQPTGRARQDSSSAPKALQASTHTNCPAELNYPGWAGGRWTVFPCLPYVCIECSFLFPVQGKVTCLLHFLGSALDPRLSPKNQQSAQSLGNVPSFLTRCCPHSSWPLAEWAGISLGGGHSLPSRNFNSSPEASQCLAGTEP